MTGYDIIKFERTQTTIHKKQVMRFKSQIYNTVFLLKFSALKMCICKDVFSEQKM